MKCGRVSSEAIAKYDRLDAGFYLGTETAEKVDQGCGESGECSQEQRKAEVIRIQSMVESGEVKPMD
jgi:hypothetical protein